MVAVEAGAIPPAREGEAAFAASGTCVVTQGKNNAWIGTGGRSSRVLHSVDRGQSWTVADTPIRQGGETTGIYGVCFTDTSRGVIVGGDYTKPQTPGANSAWTANGGETWQLSNPPPGGYRSSAARLPGTAAGLVAVGRAGADISGDGGRTWAPFGGNEGYFAVDASPDGTVIAVGAKGRAARLDIGG